MATQLKPRAIPVKRKRSVEWRYGRALSALRECVAITRDELARDVALSALKDCGAPSVPGGTEEHLAAQDNQNPSSSSSATLSVTEGDFRAEAPAASKASSATPQNTLQQHSNTVIAALYLASKLPTCQGCPDENHEVVVMAMDALKILHEMGWPGTGSFTGSRFTPVLPGVTLGCISPEARDLLDRVMKAWEPHLAALKKSNGEDYEPGHYGFAYWLIRWSGLVDPSVEKGTDKV